MNKMPIGQRVAFEYGYSVRVKNEMSGQYPVYGSNGITGYIDSYKVEGPGVIIGRKGSVGKITYSKKHFTPTDTAYYLRLLDTNKDDVCFWFYFLSILGLDKLNTHSAVPGLSRDIAYLLEVQIPGKIEQLKIAKVLSILDAKIALNNKINTELEAMAKLIYDYWFVQFDFPDANGKPYKSSGGKMVYNEALKREIPEGWHAEYIENLLAKESRAKKLPKSQYIDEGLIPVVDQSKAFICGYTNDKDTVISINDNEPRIVFGDHTCILKLINFDFARGADGTQVLLSKSANVPQYYFYHSLLKIDLSNYGYARHFKFLKQTRIIIPEYELVSRYEEMAKSFYDKIKHNVFETKQLEELRDWLLPMLMSGQVTVKGV